MSENQPQRNQNTARSYSQTLPGFPAGPMPGGFPPSAPPFGPGGNPPTSPLPGPGSIYPPAPFPGTGGGFSPTPFPGGGGGYPPGPPQGGGPGGSGGPQSPPPSFTPQKLGVSVQAVDPGSIRGCVNRYVYIWQNNGDSYWMYLTHVGRSSISGYRWYGYGTLGFWLYFGLDLRRIEQFNCF
jgi:hypothetical protein